MHLSIFRVFVANSEAIAHRTGGRGTIAMSLPPTLVMRHSLVVVTWSIAIVVVTQHPLVVVTHHPLRVVTRHPLAVVARHVALLIAQPLVLRLLAEVLHQQVASAAHALLAVLPHAVQRLQLPLIRLLRRVELSLGHPQQLLHARIVATPVVQPA